MDRFFRALWAVVAVLVAVGAAWFAADRWAQYELSAARRALDARANELALRALVPNSPLACVDAVANATVEAACEKALFASPQTIAAALDYADARLVLFADGLAHAARDPDYAPALERLRRGLELDRFGLVAQVLVSRGCTADNCPFLKLLHDSARVTANLKERTFDANVVLHAAAWRSDGPAAAPASAAATTTAPAAATATQLPSLYDFPSSASIPPVSIMNAEPPRTKAEETATAASPPPAPKPPPARRQAQPREPTAGQPTPIVPLPQPAPAAPAAR